MQTMHELIKNIVSLTWEGSVSEEIPVSILEIKKHEDCSESIISCFITLDHDIIGGCLRYESKGCYILLPCKR